MTNTTKKTATATKATETKTQNNGWERIAKRNLKNAYNWNVGGMYNDFQDGNITEEVFNNWIQNIALDMIYLEGITTRYTGDSCGGDAPKEMRFAGKDFCYKYLISLFKKDGYTVTAPEEEPKKTTTTKKPRAKKSTKITKKAATPTTVTVVLKAFTGMKIAICTGILQDSTITITTKNGKVMEFNTDGTQKTQKPGQNPKFNNKIEVITEA